jgi:hypothetical protein
MAMKELNELITEARVALRKASGQDLTTEEQEQERRKAAIEALQMELLPKLGVRAHFELLASAEWTPQGAAVTLKAAGETFHLRKEGSDSYQLLHIEGEEQIEIARINASDPHFVARVLVGIGDAIPPIPREA